MSATIFKAHVIDCYESQEVATKKGWYVMGYAPGCPTAFVRACMCDAETQFEVPCDSLGKPLDEGAFEIDLLFNLNVLLNHAGYSSCEVGSIEPWKE